MLIGISGKKMSGKDTMCNMLTEWFKKRYDGKVIKTSFAEPLKDMAINMFGLSRELVYGTDEQKNTPTQYKWKDMPHCDLGDNEWFDKADDYLTVREFLQVFGTDICRCINTNCWTNLFESRISDQMVYSVDTIHCVIDCRFPNELSAIKKKNGIVVRLTRNPFNDQHESEIALDGHLGEFDLIIDNKELTPEQTFEQLRLFIKKNLNGRLRAKT